MNGINGGLYNSRLSRLGTAASGNQSDLDILGNRERPAASGRSGVSFTGSLAGGLPRVTSQEDAFGAINTEGGGRDKFSRLGTRAGYQDVNAFNASQGDLSDITAQNAVIANLNSLASNYNTALQGIQGQSFTTANKVEDTDFYGAYNAYINSLSSAKLPDSASPEVKAFQQRLQLGYGPLTTWKNDPGSASYVPTVGFTPNYLSDLERQGVVNPSWTYTGPQEKWGGTEIYSNPPVTLPQFGITAQNRPEAYDSSYRQGILDRYDDRFYADFYNPWAGTVQNLYGNNRRLSGRYTPIIPDAPYVMQGYAGRFSDGPDGGPAGQPQIDPSREVLSMPSLQALPAETLSRQLGSGREAFGENVTYEPVTIPGETPDAPYLDQFPENVSYGKSYGAGSVTAKNNRGATISVNPRDILSTKSVGNGYSSLINVRDSSGKVVRTEWVSVSGPSNQDTRSGYYGNFTSSPLTKSPLVTYASQGLPGPYTTTTGKIGGLKRLDGTEIGAVTRGALLGFR
jgi:hypothetical protein